ncbi:serine/threonine protein kinase [Roseibium algae]|uniref:Serine/threonine protein kinase n=1 Tax=Roseibium algae TaxID=3123038 RepID=A0ABU8TLZ0_9HYPH
MRLLFLVFLFPFLFILEDTVEARIYCPLPEHGIWVNDSAAAKELSRLEIETKCVDDRLHARIRAFTKCYPRDCKWGWTKAKQRDGGGLTVMLIGFLGSKRVDVRGFDDRLDAYMTDISHDPAHPDKVKSYTLKRK